MGVRWLLGGGGMGRHSRIHLESGCRFQLLGMRLNIWSARGTSPVSRQPRSMVLAVRTFGSTLGLAVSISRSTASASPSRPSAQ